MLNVDKQGRIIHPRIALALRPHIERGTLQKIRGIIVHQTGGASADSSLNSYLHPAANGAHFLIDKDGKIYQTASMYKQTWHVGSLRARCLAEYRCTPAELRKLSKFAPRAENRMELKKRVPARYPTNADSLGVELVGPVVTAKGDDPAEKGVYESVSVAQNQSLAWLVNELRLTLAVPLSEVFRHPVVSRKNPTEAASARW